MSRWLALLVLMAGMVVIGTGPAQACGGEANLGVALVDCSTHSADDVKALWATSGTDGVRYRLQQACADDVQSPLGCFNPRTCDERPGGLLYYLLSQPLAGGDWTNLGTVCLNTEDAAGLGVITPEMVAREFRRLDWPSAPLVVEPPGGETLVNFETNFYTTLTDPETQTVRLLGQRVLIEADPVRYTWHFGDGTTQTTASPGRPYPRLTHTHAYRDPERVRVRVDVTYRGRYRINGGEWTPIPVTRTINGEAVPMRVIEAVPQLSAP